jgi:hypothetical protein
MDKKNPEFFFFPISFFLPAIASLFAVFPNTWLNCLVQGHPIGLFPLNFHSNDITEAEKAQH